MIGYVGICLVQDVEHAIIQGHSIGYDPVFLGFPLVVVIADHVRLIVVAHQEGGKASQGSGDLTFGEDLTAYIVASISPAMRACPGLSQVMGQAHRNGGIPNQVWIAGITDIEDVAGGILVIKGAAGVIIQRVLIVGGGHIRAGETADILHAVESVVDVACGGHAEVPYLVRAFR